MSWNQAYRAIRDAGWTGRKLAKHFEVSSTMICVLLAGKARSQRLEEGIAALLGISRDEFVAMCGKPVESHAPSIPPAGPPVKITGEGGFGQ